MFSAALTTPLSSSIANVWLTYRDKSGIGGTLTPHQDVALSRDTEVGLSWAGNVHPRPPTSDTS